MLSKLVDYERDYAVRRSTAGLDSTGFMEIGPGRYSGVHWQDGFVFVWENAFAMAEGIMIKHFKDYDHFAMNDIPKAIGLKIIDEWRQVADVLPDANPPEATNLLNLNAAFRVNLEEIAFTDREKIADMLRTLADECTSFYDSNGWVCVLGM